MAEVKPKSICLIPNSQRRIVDFSVGCQKEKKLHMLILINTTQL